ncbi:peptidoglycan-binding protein [Xanthobacter tagetidis]|uniref:CHAP domain-containing protein n=1 Tax=Xanthobacter tagetidis TaxID=60216 RepID=A0A3L7AGQ6_9HYPH|nr:peptidoglycan-binding protein [Xanthobacter tagetidis]MBB6306296.1 lysozyme family protein [Xanthobacter tagetidis]RLP79569.1 CHAP domain-containing protein [Xanthobacter tagetidis]
MAVAFDSRLQEEYAALFAGLVVSPSRREEVGRLAARILLPANRARYAAVEAAAGVPWFVVALIHNLEASGSFRSHLHNGDLLTARTVRVPAGLPKAAPAQGDAYSWEESAADALAFDRLDQWTDWTVPGIAFALERYNGFGYRRRYPHVKSPYLWSFSNAYTRGKFIADGVFSPDAVSQQCGAMTLLSALVEDAPEVAARLGFTQPDAPDEVARPTPHVADDGSAVDVPGDPPRFPGKYLLPGSREKAAIRKVQERLAQMGASPGAPSGAFDTPTHFAVQLFQSRAADLEGVPLEIDGIVGPKTWGALFGPLSIDSEWVKPSFRVGKREADLASAVIEIAEGEIDVREVPPGSNRGPQVEAYLSSVGLKGGNPWCMAFVHWCFAGAAGALGVPNRVPATGHVRTSWQQTGKIASGVRVVTAQEAARDPSLVTAGMVFFLGLDGGTGHAGIVAANVNGLLSTIEGNTNDGGSREGIGVFRRVGRKVTDAKVLGYAAFG